MRGKCPSAKLPFCLIFSILCVAIANTSLLAQDSAQSTIAALSASAIPLVTPVTPLITQPIDEHQLTVLKGNVHALARPQFDLGTAPASLPMQRMLLVLKRSPQQETALRKLLDDQQDKHSPNYHKWLTPEQYGKQFGPADSDMQVITSWLQSHGFQLGAPTEGRTVLEFSGSASQVQEAFHTAIHKYVINGEQHWANSTDPQIPTALTPAVAGVLTLHNFLKKPLLHYSGKPVAAKLHPGKRPYVTLGDGTHALGPYDYATIYHSPAFTGGVTGAGITVAIVGRSNLFNGGQDVQNFASYVFDCCGSFQITLNGPDPGDTGGGDEAEATLDTTWAGAVAPSAQADLVVSASTNTADGVDLSEVYIIENNLAGIMSESFGSCEADATDAAGTEALAEQAAAQGITYFVSTGDSGAEGCDDPDTETIASGPVSVNVLASTNFNIAVGGSMFNENGNDSLYWSATNTNNASALSYIPEDVWNESCVTCTDPAIWAGGGGVSVDSNGVKPSWQSGVAGIPTDNARDLPDVVLTAAGHDAYVVCLEGSCVPDSTGELSIFLISGTSAAAPSFAGVMAMVEEQVANTNPGLSSRQGQANYVLYRLAAAEATPLSQCNASNTAALPNSACIFNDVTIGNNAVPGEVNYGASTAQYQAGVGYDLATGLGSVNITNLINEWNTVTFSPTTTMLAFNPTTVNVVHGAAVNLNITVAPNSGTGTPTGDVSLLAISNLTDGQTAVDRFTLSTGAVSGTTNQLPGGTYTVTANYAGDGTYAPSVSTPVSVTVSPEASATALSVLTFNSQGQQLNFTTGPFGSFVYLRADVAASSGHGTPTGSVTFSDTFGAIPGITGPLPLNTGDTLNGGSSNTATPNGVITFDAGTHIISASYSGDPSFSTSFAPPITFAISPGFFAELTGPSEVVISAPGGTGTTALQVAYSSGLSGTISLACSGLPSETTCSFSPSSISVASTSTTTPVTVTVTTTAAHTVTSENHRKSPYLLAQYFAGSGFALAGVFFFTLPKRRRAAISSLMILLTLLVVLPACGGGGGSSTKVTTTTDPGTPTNSNPLTITVTATNGSNTSSTAFGLVVQ
jgi:hypothetical protein